MPEPDPLKWATWFEFEDRSVGNTYVGEVRVSTVFLGTDMAFGRGEPILFETMVFGGKYDGEGERYRTYREAVSGHAEWVRRCSRYRSIDGDWLGEED